MHTCKWWLFSSQIDTLSQGLPTLGSWGPHNTQTTLVGITCLMGCNSVSHSAPIWILPPLPPTLYHVHGQVPLSTPHMQQVASPPCTVCFLTPAALYLCADAPSLAHWPQASLLHHYSGFTHLGCAARVLCHVTMPWGRGRKQKPEGKLRAPSCWCSRAIGRMATEWEPGGPIVDCLQPTGLPVGESCFKLLCHMCVFNHVVKQEGANVVFCWKEHKVC